MFGLARRTRAGRRAARNRTVLWVEGLESRDQPSGETTDGTVSVISSPGNLRPVIEDFVCQEISNGLFVISGRVVDESPGGLTVTLGGDTSAAGLTCTTLDDGTFSITVRLQVDGSDLGWITATTVDAQGLVSEEAEAFVNPTPP